MNHQIFDQLPKEFPREFLPADLDFLQPEKVLAIQQELLKRPLSNIEEVNQWITDLFEYKGGLRESYSKAHILATCHTDQSEYTDREKYFFTDLFPPLTEGGEQLNQRFVELSEQFNLDKKRYGILIRSCEADTKLYSPANIPLSVEESNLGQQYFAIRGAMTIDYDGKEQTMSQMFKYLESPDSEVRKSAWLARVEKELEVKEEINSLFDRLVQIRVKKAANSDCKDFIESTFLRLRRFEYSPADCQQFHESIEKVVVPLVRKIHQEKMKMAGLSKLRPWDINFDPRGAVPLKPFADTTELIAKMRKVMKRMDPDFDRWFSFMDQYNLLDLASRKGKAPGGYSCTLAEKRVPFIFMNATGTDWDMRVLLHELGHAFHAFSLRNDLINYNSHAPMEFNEVASMSLELLGDGYMDEFYVDKTDQQRSSQKLFERVIVLLTSVGRIDAFQHWLYANPGHTQAERDVKWLELSDRFSSGLIDWTGYEQYKAHGWQSVLHIIKMPFYYVEYGIAQLGALQIWRNSQKDFVQAMEDYKRGISAGNTNTLPELFQHAGIEFSFDEKMIQGLMDFVAEKRFK